MPIKLIATDLDGTLLDEQHRCPPENHDAIREAERRGIIVVISTGRAYPSADTIVSTLDLGETPIICYNGAMIRLPAGGELLFHAPVPADLAAEIVQECARRDFHLNYYLDDVMYVAELNEWSVLYEGRTTTPSTPVGDLRRFDGQAPTKLLICQAPEVIDALMPEMEQRYAGRLYITRSMPEYLELLSLGASKGHALRWLAEHYGIDISETMGLGDQLNDLPLIETAGIGVAMPNAVPEVLAAADYIAHEQLTGVAEAIRELT